MFAPLDNSNLQVSLRPYRAAKMIAVKWLFKESSNISE